MVLVTVTEFRNNLSKYLEMAFREKIALKSKRGIIELTPSTEIHLNPSPSNDPWFENKANVEELDNRLADIDSGKTQLLDWDDVKGKLGL
ncbi:MAG: addiction module protein [Rikenellaceae bacterium]